MKKFALLAFVFGMFGLLGSARAADDKDPTGTYKYTTKFGNKEQERTLKLEYKDGKLSGTVTTGKDTETKIEDATFKDGAISFTVTRERNGTKIVSKYTGKFDGETIKGKIKTDFGGKENEADFEAKKQKS